jgi:hypothetical protein
MTTLPTHVDLSRQKIGTKFLVETEAGVWELTLRDPEELLVHVSSTDKNFKHAKQPILGQFVQSNCTKSKVVTFENGKLVKGWTFAIRFADATLVSRPTRAILIEGDGWKYEL